MLLDCICRLCLGSFENPETSLMEITAESVIALETVFRITVCIVLYFTILTRFTAMLIFNSTFFYFFSI